MNMKIEVSPPLVAQLAPFVRTTDDNSEFVSHADGILRAGGAS